MPTVRFKGSREDLKRALQALPALLAGKTDDPSGLVRLLHLRTGEAALHLFRDAYIDKSRDGVDETGDTWLLAKEKTEAARHETLVSTGALLKSLTPGAPFNVLEPGKGEIVVGSAVPYALAHHRGTAKLPKRRLWPAPERWPNHWWRTILRALLDGALPLAADVVRRNSA